MSMRLKDFEKMLTKFRFIYVFTLTYAYTMLFDPSNNGHEIV